VARKQLSIWENAWFLFSRFSRLRDRSSVKFQKFIRISNFQIMQPATLPQVRVKDKRQITLPAAVAQAAGINVNDVLGVSYKDGVVSLITQRAAQKRRPSLLELAGSTRGLYGRTTEERQAYIASERASWQR
jgi:bifunctional DNA-binding transcriptional regulator/antitoxin component of YhaV-PrlF toxin-antitoxin module